MSEKKRISEKISDLNLKNILGYLIRNPEGVARTELCKNLHVSFPAVSNNVKKLMEQGIVLEEEKVQENGSVGRNPKIVKLNGNYGMVITVHVGYRTVEINMLDMSMKIINRMEFEISKNISFNDLLEVLIHKINAGMVSCETGFENGNVVGVSVALPGVVDNVEKKLVSSKFYNWSGISLPEILNVSGNDVSVFWENDSNVLATGIFFRNPELDNILAFYMGVGIGIGIFINKKLYTGSRGMAGEMGRITFPVGDKTISLEQFISEKALVDFARENLGIEEKNYQLALRKMDERIDDNKVREKLDIVSNYIGNFFAILVRAFDPQKVTFDGTVVRNCPNLSGLIVEKLIEYSQINENQICIANSSEKTMSRGLYSIVIGKSLGLEYFGG